METSPSRFIPASLSPIDEDHENHEDNDYELLPPTLGGQTEGRAGM